MKKLIVCLFSVVIAVCAMNIRAFAAPSLNRSEFKIVEGASTVLSVLNSDKNAKIVWSSDNEDVATVSSDGRVTAVSAGKSQIYATAGGALLKCGVTVVAPSVTASKNEIIIKKGESKTIEINSVGSKNLRYELSDKSSVAVSFGKWDGNVITVKFSGIKAGTYNFKIFMANNKKIYETIKITVTGDSEANDFRGNMLERVNAERKAAGLGALTLNDKLNEAAGVRAGELISSFSHTRPNGKRSFTVLDGLGFDNKYLAENIARGIDSSECALAMNMWMESQMHKENILGVNYKELGIGYAEDSSGEGHWVQIFSS